MKLKNHKYAQCSVSVHEEYGVIDFMSYETLVVRALKCESGASWLVCFNQRFSRITSKQIRWFLQEYFPEIADIDVPYSGKINTIQKKPIFDNRVSFLF